MNHLYRSLWNDVTRTFVAVAEVARGRGKRSSDSRTAGTGDPAVAQSPSLLRPMALEPRLMFDAAAVGAVVEVVREDAATPAAVDHRGSVVEAARQWAQLVPAAVEVSQQEVTLARAEPARRELVFVDASVTGAQSLVEGIDPAAEVILIPAGKHGLQAIADALHGRSGIDAIHILSHGDTGKIQLGGEWVDSAALAVNAELLASIGQSLAEDGDVLLYGCRVGADGAGIGFIQSLAAATGADIAASHDATGAASQGGNWVLEATHGTIEAAAVSPASYTGLLAAFSDDFSSNPGTSADSYVRTLGGVNFTYTFTSDGDGGDGNGGLYFDSYGSGGSAAMLLRSGLTQVSTTERVTITRTDLADFTFNSLFLDNSGGGGDVTVGGYLNGVLVGSAQTFTTGTTTLSFGGIRVDEVRLTSTEFRDLAIDDFAGDTDPPGAAPVATASGGTTAFTEGNNATSTPVVVDSGLTLSDADNSTLVSGTVAITGNFQNGQDVLAFSNTNTTTFGNIVGSYAAGTGILTLSSAGGTATVAQWQAALRATTYTNSSDSPNTSNRTVSFVVSDGATNSSATTKSVSVSAVNDTPVTSASGGSVAFTEGNNTTSTPVSVDSGFTVSDVDSATLSTGTVSITGGLQSSEDVLAFVNTNSTTFGNISASYSSGTGVLSLSSAGATATVAQWQAALRAVTYTNSSEAPNTGNRTVSFAVNDGSTGSSAVTRTVTIASVNDTPLATTSGGSTAFTEGNNVSSTPVVVDGGFTVSDADTSTFASATVSITGNLQTAQDLLAFTNNPATMGNISASYSAGIGVLSLSSAGATATAAQWQAALRAVTYTNSSDTPSASNRTVSFTVNDGTADGNAVTKTVTVTATDDTPIATTTGGVTAASGSTPVAIDGGITLSDLDSTTLASATVSVTANFQSGEDVLAFANTNSTTFGNVTASYSSGTGVLTLTSAGATATLAQWQSALAAVTYANTASTPNVSARTVSFAVNDGSSSNTAAVKTISVQNAPVLGSLTGDSVAWAGVGSMVGLDAGANAALSDVELDALNGGNGDWAGASLTVQRSGTAVSADTFGFNTSGALFTVSGGNLQSGGQTFATFTATGGVLAVSFTSSGTAATTALAQDVVRRVTYRSDMPAGDATLRFTLSDGSASTTADVTVTSDSIYVTNATDTATIDVSNGVSLSEAVAIAAADATGSQTLILTSALAGQTVTLSGALSLDESLTLDADAASGVVIAGSTLSLAGGTTLTVGHGSGDTVTVDSAIIGSGSLTQTGLGTLQLNGSNSYAGATQVLAGTLVANHGNALGSTVGSTTVATGAMLRVGAGITIAEAISVAGTGVSGAGVLALSSGSTTLSGTITLSGDAVVNSASGATLTLSGLLSGGAQSLTKEGAGTLVLANTGNRAGMSGGITVRGGTLSIAEVDHLAAGTLTLDGGALSDTSTAAHTLVNALVIGSGGGTFQKGAGNALTLTGALNGSGAITTSGAAITHTGSGTLTLDGTGITTGANSALTLGSNVVLGSGGATFSAGTSANITLQGVVSGAGNYTKSGAGWLVFGGSNTHSGTQSITAGQLAMTAGASLGTGQIQLAASTRLRFVSVGTVTVTNDLVLSAGNVNIEADNAGVSVVTLTGTRSESGGVANLLVSAGNAAGSRFILSGSASYTGYTSLNKAVSITDASNVGTGALRLPAAVLQITGSNAVFAQNVIPTSESSIEVPNSVTFAGVVSDIYRLIKLGAGTLALTGTNTHVGAFNVTEGTLALYGGASLSNTGLVTVSAGATLALNANETIGGLAGAGTVSLGAYTLTTAGSSSPTFSGSITGSGGLTKQGSGLLTLSGINTYTGPTTITAGGVQLSGGAALSDSSAVVMSGSSSLLLTTSETVGSLSGTGTVDMSANTLTVGSNGSDTSFAGVITGSGGLSKTGSGTLTLTGNNTYTGTTQIDAGALQVNRAGGALGDSSAVTVGAGATLTLLQSESVASLAGAGMVSLGSSTLTTLGSASTTFSGAIAGTGGLTKSGTGTLTLSGTNTYIGTTTLNAGGLTLTGGAALSDISSLSTNAGTTLTLDASEAVGSLAGSGSVALGASTLTAGANGSSTTFAGVIGGTGGLTKSGSGTLTLTGNNTYTGATTVSAGTLALNRVGGALADASAVTVASGASLWLQQDEVVASLAGDGALTLDGYLLLAGAASSTFSGQLSGAGPLYVDGGGTLTLTGSNSGSYTGGAFVRFGSTLAVAGDANLGSGVVTLNGGTLTVTGAGTIDNGVTLDGSGGTVDVRAAVTLSGALGGSATLTVADNGNNSMGELTLSNNGNAASFTGNTVVNRALWIAGDANLGSGSLTLDGGYLFLSGGSVIDNAVVLNGFRSYVYAQYSQSGATTFTGSISGTGGVETLGALHIAGVASYTGFTWVLGGVLEVTGSLTGSTFVYVGGELGGTGSIGTQGVLSEVRTQGGGRLSPGQGAGGIGTLTLNSDWNAPFSAQLTVDVRGTTAGTTHDQVVVQGAVVLYGATLTPDFGNYVATAGDTFELIRNDGSDAVTPFSFQPEGTLFTANGRSYRLSYVGGDGNDVTLTALNAAPTVVNALVAQSATEESAFSFTVPLNTFADIDVGDTWTYSATLADGSVLPAWLSFNAATRTFSGTPLNGDVGAITVKVIATDGSNNAGSGNFVLAVANTNDAPTSNGIAAQSATEDAAFSFTVPANAFTDVDAGDTLTYTATLASGGALPAWLSFNAATRTFSGTPLNGDVGAITVRVTLTDGSNASATSDFTLTVANTNDAPTGAAIAAQAATEDSAFSFQVPANTFADVDVGDTLAYTAMLANGGALPTWLSFDAATRTFSGTPLNGDVGAITVRVTATDGSNASGSSDFTLTVANTNDAPTSNGIAAQSATEDAAFSFQLPANAFADVDVGDTLTYTATLASGGSLPTWLSFNAATRTFSGTPLNADVGAITVRVTATDGNSTSASSDFTLTVANSNDAPTGAAIAAQAATEDSAFSFQVPANTFADVDVGDTLTYTATLANGGALPAWLSFNAATRTVSGTPLNADVGAIAVRVTATDGSNASGSSDFTLTVANTNDAPTSNGIAAQSATEDAAFSFTVPANAFTDVDAGDTLTYTATLASGGALPTWLSFNAATRTFSGTPRNGDVGAITVRVTATDGSNAVAASDFTLAVANTNDAPTSNGIAGQSATEDAAFSFTVPANAFTDVDVGDTLTYTATLASGGALPVWLNFDAATRTFSGTPRNGDVGAITVRVVATDGSNASAASDFTLTVANTNDVPTSTAIAARSATEDSAFSFQLPANAFTDVDAGDTLTYTATLVSGAALPAWLSFDAATSTFSGTPLNGDVGAITVRVTATDGSSTSATSDFTLTVVNTNDAPTARPISLQSVAEDSPWVFTVPASTFADVDAGDVLTYTATLSNGAALPAWLRFNAATLTFTGTPANDDVGIIAIKVTATDASNVSVASEFALFVSSTNDAPTGSAIAAQTATEDSAFSFTVPAGTFVDVDAGDTLSYTALLASGAPLPAWLSFNTTTRTFSGTPANGDVGVIAIQVSATDASNARASSIFTLTVVNTNDAPTVVAAIAAQAATAKDPYSFTVPASSFADVDAGDTLRYSAALADGAALPVWLSFDAATRTFSGTPTNGDAGAIKVRVTATDASGASVSASFALTVEPVAEPPVPDAPLPPLPSPVPAPMPVAAAAVPQPLGTVSFLSPAAAGLGLESPAQGFGTAPTLALSSAPVNTGAQLERQPDAGSVGGGVVLTLPSAPGRPAALQAAQPDLGDFSARSGEALSVTLPSGVFTHTDPASAVTLEVRLANGRPLPAWLRFDPVTRTLIGQPPLGLSQKLSIELIARDSQGRQATSHLDIDVRTTTQPAQPLLPARPGASLDERPAARPGFSEQLRSARLPQRSALGERLAAGGGAERASASQRG